MAIRNIVVFPDDRLRLPTQAVTEFDDKLKTLVEDMFDSMYAHDGLGLAAPQIGVNKSVVVIDIADCDDEGNVLKHNPMVLINPKILEKQGVQENTEGCLSVPDFYEKVSRAEIVKVQAQDLEGKEHIYNADGLLGICMQHEIDHLEGHLFIDYLSTFKRERIKKRLQQKQREARHNQEK